jgi:hypothetical protein
MTVTRQTLIGMSVARQILIGMAVAGKALIGMTAKARAPKAGIDRAGHVTDLGHSTNYNMTKHHQLSPI